MATTALGPFRFLDLPTKVRGVIYCLLFSTSSIGIDDADRRVIPRLTPVRAVEITEAYVPWKTLLACRQISEEAAPILHQLTILSASISSSGHLHHLEGLLPTEYLARLTKLQITITHIKNVQNLHHSHFRSLFPKLKEMTLMLDFRQKKLGTIRDSICKQVISTDASEKTRYSDDDFHQTIFDSKRLPLGVTVLVIIWHPLQARSKNGATKNGNVFTAYNGQFHFWGYNNVKPDGEVAYCKACSTEKINAWLDYPEN